MIQQIAHKLIISTILMSAVAPFELKAQEDNEAGALEEIIVTARKREENLQMTPFSIAAFSDYDTTV